MQKWYTSQVTDVILKMVKMSFTVLRSGVKKESRNFYIWRSLTFKLAKCLQAMKNFKGMEEKT